MSEDGAHLLDIAQRVVAEARKQGATAAEAYTGTLEGISIEHMGSLASAREVRESGIGVRLIMGNRYATSATSGTSERAIARVVAEAVRRARAKPESKELPVFAPPTSVGPPTRIHPALISADADALAQDAAALAARMSSAPDVTFHATELWTYLQRFAIANTEGLAAWDQDAIQILRAESRVTRAGVARTARETAVSDAPLRDSFDLDALAQQVVDRARLATDAKPLPAPVDDVVFAPYPAAQMINLWLPSLVGSATGARAHPRAKPIGAEVLSPLLNISDAPRSAGGPRRQRIDDEGTPTRDASLVERGILRERLFSTSAAAREGSRPTGHCYRSLIGRWASKAAVRPGNMVVAPGNKSIDDIIASMDRGIVVTDQLMGAFIANGTSGDFSFVAPTSLYVECGAVVHALPSLTLGGNVHETLRNVVDVGRDSTAVVHGVVPHIRVRGVACAT